MGPWPGFKGSVSCLKEDTTVYIGWCSWGNKILHASWTPRITAFSQARDPRESRGLPSSSLPHVNSDSSCSCACSGRSPC